MQQKSYLSSCLIKSASDVKKIPIHRIVSILLLLIRQNGDCVHGTDDDTIVSDVDTLSFIKIDRFANKGCKVSSQENIHDEFLKVSPLIADYGPTDRWKRWFEPTGR